MLPHTSDGFLLAAHSLDSAPRHFRLSLRFDRSHSVVRAGYWRYACGAIVISGMCATARSDSEHAPMPTHAGPWN